MNPLMKRKIKKIIEGAKYLEDTDPILALFEEEIEIDLICEYFGWPLPPTSPMNDFSSSSSYTPQDKSRP